MDYSYIYFIKKNYNTVTHQHWLYGSLEIIIVTYYNNVTLLYLKLDKQIGFWVISPILWKCVKIVCQIKTCGIDMQKLTWRVYATQWVGLGLWGKCVSYVCENCVLYARQSPFLRINTTSFHFYLAYYLFIRIFMKLGYISRGWKVCGLCGTSSPLAIDSL